MLCCAAVVVVVYRHTMREKRKWVFASAADSLELCITVIKGELEATLCMRVCVLYSGGV